MIIPTRPALVLSVVRGKGSFSETLQAVARPARFAQKLKERVFGKLITEESDSQVVYFKQLLVERISQSSPCRRAGRLLCEHNVTTLGWQQSLSAHILRRKP